MTTPPYDSRTQALDQRSAAPTEAQRAFVIQRISEAFSTDRLTVEQLDERLASVYAARTAAELEHLLADVDAPAQYSGARMRIAHEFTVPERGVGMAVMGGFQRGAGWVVPRRFKAFAVMGGVELDLREARLAPGITEIDVFTLWGGVEIIVPDGVRVEVVGAAVMGGFGAITDAANLDDPNAPVLRISGFALMAGVDVKRKEPSKKKGRAFVQALERAERSRPRHDPR